MTATCESEKASSQTRPVRGRFAPTPSGGLHAGSLLVAVASFLAARSLGGEWHVRIDDLDPHRTVPGAADDILRTLEAHALTWDGPVIFQSAHRAAHEAALSALRQQGLAYPCSCTRREVFQRGQPGEDGPIYDGRCRHGPRATDRPPTWRVRTDGARVAFEDAVCGRVERTIETRDGDFVLWRGDDVPGFQLASTVDDALGDYDHIVRGSDLLASSARQTFIRQALGLPSVRHAHLPLVLDAHGAKLAKSTHAHPVARENAHNNLRVALARLGIHGPTEPTTPVELLAWGTSMFRRVRFRNVAAEHALATTPPAS